MKLNKNLLVLFFLLSIFSHAERVDVNFRNININDFIKMVKKIININISIDEEVNGRIGISFVSNQSIEKSNMIPLTQIILKSKGMTLENIEDGYKVVKIREKTEVKVKTVLFQLKEKNIKLTPLLKKCKEYEYISNKDGSFYLVVTDTNKMLIAIKQAISKTTTLKIEK